MPNLSHLLARRGTATLAEVKRGYRYYLADRSGQLTLGVMGRLTDELGETAAFVDHEGLAQAAGHIREARVEIIDFLDRFDDHVADILCAAAGKLRSDILAAGGTTVGKDFDGRVTDELDPGYRRLTMVVYFK